MGSSLCNAVCLRDRRGHKYRGNCPALHKLDGEALRAGLRALRGLWSSSLQNRGHPYTTPIGQFETEIRSERQMDGIKKAKGRGVQFGKRPALTSVQVSTLREKRKQGTLIKDLMAHYGLSKATIYRYLGTKDA